MEKPRLVFIVPVMPSFSGMGPAMRAAHTLEALALRFEVSLAVIGLIGFAATEPTPEIRVLCRRFLHLPVSLPPSQQEWPGRAAAEEFWAQKPLPAEWAAWTPEKGAELEAFVEAEAPEQVWIFRFYLLPWVGFRLWSGKPVCLDLDECESRQRLQLGKLQRLGGRSREAMGLIATSGIYQRLEKRFLPRFDFVVAASETEAAAARAAGAVRVDVWPNTISLPAQLPQPPAPRSPNEPVHLFFVGYLGYLPNQDAVQFAAREILPVLRERLGRPVLFQAAGGGWNEARQELADCSDVEMAGRIPDLAPFYARADLVLVPLRAGTGTRLKILEAFAHRKPVVSSTIGAEGLAIEPGRTLLIADTAQELADACVSVLTDPGRAAALAQAGHAFVHQHHGPQVLAACVDRFCR
jgi:glycosyltransferase involved in cell wall biosynthesis